MTDQSIPSYQQRVYDEKSALDKKRDSLTEFLKKELYKNLSKEEQVLLSKQLEVMSQYSNILAERIAHF